MSYTPHVQWLDCPCGARVHGIVRLFENPVKPDVGGMPGQAWAWCCNFEAKDGVAIIRAALIAPPKGGLRPLLDLARDLGCQRLLWERFDTGVVRLVRFNL